MDKPKKIIVGLVIFIILESVLGIFFVIGYFDLVSSYEKTTEELSGLQNLHRELEDNYTSLKENHLSLEKEYEDLTERHTTLKETLESLVENFTSLKTQYIELGGNWSRLERTRMVEEALSVGNSLQSYYDLVRQEKGLDGTKGSWNPDQAQVEFAARLASHDLGNPYLPAVEREFEEAVGQRSYEIANTKIEEIISLIGVSQGDSSVDKIRKILNFTNQYIHYEYEVSNVYRAPVETLGLRSGDCDDYTILVAAFFEAVGIDSAIGSFKNATEAYHYMVLIHLEDLPGYEYLSFSDLTKIGLEKGRWIVIEPQYLIENQGNDWVKQWILLTAAPVEE